MKCILCYECILSHTHNPFLTTFASTFISTVYIYCIKSSMHKFCLRNIFFLFICICVCAQVCGHLGVVGGSEQPDVGTGNWTQVLCRDSKCCQLLSCATSPWNPLINMIISSCIHPSFFVSLFSAFLLMFFSHRPSWNRSRAELCGW